ASASGRAGEDRHLDRLIGGASRHLPFDEARSPPEGEAERPEGAGHVLPEEYAADLELLAGAAEGRGDAVRTLLDEAGPVVYGFVFARVGGQADVAEDIVQDTFVEAMRSASGFRGEAALTTWLCTIARRRLARHYDRERREAVVS